MSNRKQQTLFYRHLHHFITALILLGLIKTVSLFFVYQHYLEKENHDFQMQQTDLLLERLDKKQKIVHAVAIAFAHSSTIRQALVYEEREPIIRELSNLREDYAQWTGFENYAFHVITPDARSLVRSYDIHSFGQDLSDHPFIQYMLKTQRPSIGVARGGANSLFRMLAIQPIFDLHNHHDLIGYIGVSQGLKTVVSEFAQDGILYAIFYPDPVNKIQDQAVYVVEPTDYFSDPKLRQLSFSQAELNIDHLGQKDGICYHAIPIKDSEGKIIAYHLLAKANDAFIVQAWQETLTTAWMLLGIFTLIVGFGSLQLWLIRQTISKPMQQMTHTIEDILLTEQYNRVVRIERRDEIGEMSELFNQLLYKTDHLIFSLQYQQQAIDKTLIVSRANTYGTIIGVNDNFCDISGYTRAELLGKPHSIVRHPDNPNSIFADMWSTIKQNKIWTGNIRNRRKDGSSYHVLSYIIPVLDKEGRLIEYMSIREDITTQVELQASLETALQVAEAEKLQAQQANKAKSEFIASMSHELRTPLNAIIGFAQVLEQAQLNPKQHKQICNIHKSGQHLLNLINDILDFAKLENAGIHLSLIPVNLQQLLMEVMALSESHAQQKHIAIDCQETPDHYYLLADPLRLTQVLLNLVSNAIKYNKPNGEVSLTWTSLSEAEKSYLSLSVRDTGVGIPQQQQVHLFEPFNRLGHEGSDIEGTGIGLSITKDLVEKMNGSISFTSEEGKGTEFTVTFEQLTDTQVIENYLEKTCVIEPSSL